MRFSVSVCTAGQIPGPLNGFGAKIACVLHLYNAIAKWVERSFLRRYKRTQFAARPVEQYRPTGYSCATAHVHSAYGHERAAALVSAKGEPRVYLVVTLLAQW